MTSTDATPAAATTPTVNGPSATEPSSVELKSFDKVYGVPIIRDFLAYAHATLSGNSYVAPAYNTGLGIGSQAVQYSKTAAQNPYVAPFIGRADDAVLHGLKAVEQRFPYPFQANAEQMYTDANGQFDAHVRTPVTGFATSADAKLAPVLDQLEVLVNKYSTSEASRPTADATVSDETQFARAVRLGKHARDEIALLSSEQFKHLQQQNVVIQRATESVHSLNETLQAVGKDYSTKAQGASSEVLSEVEKVKAAIASLPSFIQSSVKPLQVQLSQSASELQSVVGEKDVATRDKAAKVASAVQNQIGPVLEALKETFNNLTKAASEKKSAATEEVKEKTS